MPKELIKLFGLVTVRYHNIETGETWLDDYYNTITDAGDLYIAQKVTASTPPSNLSPPNLINGCKLGSGAVTGGNTPAKNGSGAVLAAYITGSNKSLDDVSTPGFGGGPYPKIDNSLGPGGGVRAVYVVSYPAGTVVANPVTEAILCTDTGTNLTSGASQTISRAAIGPYNKTSSVEIDIVWQHLHQGA